MGPVFYKKLFSRLSISIILSYIISEFIFKSQLFFVFSLSLFGSIYLLIGWLEYLKLDGADLFNSKTLKYFRKAFIFLDRFSYKNKGVYNMDNEPILEYETNKEATKASIYANVLCGLILLIGSQII